MRDFPYPSPFEIDSHEEFDDSSTPLVLYAVSLIVLMFLVVLRVNIVEQIEYCFMSSVHSAAASCECIVWVPQSWGLA